MHIEWNKVTWYSKLASVIYFLGIFPILTFYIGTQYEFTMMVIDQASQSQVQHVVYQKEISHIPTMPGVASTTPPSVQKNAVTMEDNTKEVHVKLGQRFLLNLGNYQWDLNFSDPTIVSRVKNIAVINGAQGVYTADNVGTTELSATGRPFCEPGQMCSMMIIAFKTKIIVDR